MENLAVPRIACFCCNRTISEGNRFVLVNRLHKVRKASTKDEIVCGMASLQTCMSCAAKARNEEIAFNETPVPLLRIERIGFYSYAKNLDPSTQPGLPQEKTENCSFCGLSIGEGEPYIEIEVHEEINCEHPEVVPDSTRVLALACEECTQTYMLWL